MPWIGFLFLMGHMLISHLYRELYPEPGVVDVTGAQMVLVMKLTAFCWNVYDGQQPVEVGLTVMHVWKHITDHTNRA